MFDSQPSVSVTVFNGFEDKQIIGDVFQGTCDPRSLIARNCVSSQGGWVSLDARGSFVYTPPVGFNGVDSFTCTVRDAHGLASISTVQLNVAASDMPSIKALAAAQMRIAELRAQRQPHHNRRATDGFR